MLNISIVPTIGMLLTCILKSHQLLEAYMESPIINRYSQKPADLTPNKVLSPNKTGSRKAMVRTEYSSMGGCGL